MEVSPDPYEQKLYQMFQSYDTESRGTLNETALSGLCQSLELQDHGIVLIRSLIKSKESRVSFKDFKEALLNFLGTDMDASDREKSLVISEDTAAYIDDSQQDQSDREVSPKFVVGSKKYGRRSRPQSLVTDSSPSDTDDPETVVPNLNAQVVQRSSSQSDIPHNRRRRLATGGTKVKRCASLPAKKNQRTKDPILARNQAASVASQTQQNASSVESLGNLDFENLTIKIHDIWKRYGNEIGTNYLNCNDLRTVCERVGLVQKIAVKVADEVFEKLHLNANCDRISFDDFIDLIHGADSAVGATSMERQLGLHLDAKQRLEISSIGIDDDLRDNSLCTLVDEREIRIHPKDAPLQLETIPAHSIIEMWERANIHDPKHLLTNLGFYEDDEVNMSELSKVLDTEIRALEEESQMPLLRAALVLQKAEISSLQQTYRHLVAENKKLHSDNKDANRRAALMAQEIDERHASLEDTTKMEIRLLEQRHAEVVREISMQLANDRENWSNLNARLEKRIKMLEQDESKLKCEIHSLKSDNSALEGDHATFQKQITELLEANIKLNNEIVELEARSEYGSKGEKETEEVLELIDKITTLQLENANLRDKNDELVAEVEGLNMEISRNKTKKTSRSVTTEIAPEVLSDDPEHSASGIKRRGDSPSKTRITEESPRLGKFRKCSNELAGSESDSGDWVALNSELNNPVVTPTTTSGFSQDFSSISDSKDEEIKQLKDKLSKLEQQLSEMKKESSSSSTGQPQDVLAARCKELETSLEQMRKAYDDCEDYWQSKLGEERLIYDKERQIYEDEQQENDKKFTELMEKVREYEEQFSKDGRLSPIDEKENLEQQYNDLEAEMEEIRERASSILEEKSKEIEELQEEVQELKEKLQESVQFNESSHFVKHNPSDMESPASSPISYLWNQSTIQSPIVNQLMNFNRTPQVVDVTTKKSPADSVDGGGNSNSQKSSNISPIQKPSSGGKSRSDGSTSNKDGDDSSSVASRQSFDTNSIASTHSVNKTSSSSCASPNGVKEELKRLKFFEVQLKEQIKDLAIKRDSLITELQQLQEAKPVMEKAYARAAHPTLMQRANQLELKNRHLQNVIKQQQQYTESVMQQTWQQQQFEISELRNRLENQSLFINDQSQKLANADILVKDLFVENAHLSATIQTLEQQRSRANILQQQHHHGLSGVPGLP